METEGLRQALDIWHFDAAFGGARRDEEKSRAKESIFSHRSAAHAWDPRNQRPEFWSLFNARIGQGESMRVFPLSNWTEVDVWDYIAAEGIPVVPLYFAKERPVVERDGTLIMVDDDRLPLRPGEDPRMEKIRFRTLGCYPLTGAIRSERDFARDHRGNARLDDVGAGGPTDRSRRIGFDGKEKARGIFLMLEAVPISPRSLSMTPAPPTLRLITCGSVDDGKSTLIGRLLVEQSLILDDQMAALERDSRRHGTDGDNIDFALLVDGLEVEREQGITIDVAYRYVSTAQRSFIIADTPGHEQYTRNMATGASGADLAILLVDARKGILTQTRRHAAIVSLIGIKHVVLAVNKIDLTGFDEEGSPNRGRFQRLRRPARFQVDHADSDFGAPRRQCFRKSANTPWYDGPALLDFLESIDVEEDGAARPFRFPVQWVNRPHLDFRGFAGTIASGTLRPGDEIVVAASGSLIEGRADRHRRWRPSKRSAGDAVTLVLADELDIARGDVLCDPKNRPEVSDQFAAHLIWMSEGKLLPRRSYLLKTGHKTVAVTITLLKHRLDVNTLGEMAAQTLSLNEVGFCNLATAMPIAFDPYAANHATGAFILIDRVTNATAAAGLIAFSLRRATNVHLQGLDVAKIDRARLNNHRPVALWFTGLSGSGKSTIANLVESRLYAHGAHTILLDGDNVRHGLNKDLGFTEFDRIENIRRIGEVAKLMTEAGFIVLCSFISPFQAERRLVRELLDDGNSSRSSSIRRSPIASRAIQRASTKKPSPARSRTLRASISPMSRRSAELIVARTARPPQAAADIVALLTARRHRPHRRSGRRLVDLRIRMRTFLPQAIEGGHFQPLTGEGACIIPGCPAL